MKTVLRLLTLFAVLAVVAGCGMKDREVRRLILESQAKRDAGELSQAEALLIEATKIMPMAEEPWLELGILKDEYLKDPEGARSCYENFLTVSKNPKMQEMVRGWLEDQKEGVSLPLTEVSEMPREARELLEKRTAQFEELRRNLVNRYESELDKYRDGQVKAAQEAVVITQTVEVASNTESEEAKAAAEAARQLAFANEKARKAEEELKALKEEKEKLKEMLALESKDKEEARQREQDLKDLKDKEKAAEAEARTLADEKAKAEKEALLAQAEAEKQARILAEQKAKELEEEKKKQAEKLDAFVKDVVQAGSESAAKSVVTASEMEKISQLSRHIDLELSEDTALSETAAQLEVPEIPGLKAADENKTATVAQFETKTAETKSEPVKTELPKTEPPKTERPKAAVAKTEPPKAETSKAKSEVARTEPPKAETPKAKSEAAKTESAEGYDIHVVGQGDSLGSISRKYYGEFRRWREIYDANRDVLPNPDRLKLGMKLRIPKK